MPIYRVVKQDCKYYVEEGLRKLRWKVNSNLQEKYGDRECAVVYSGYKSKIDTTESYWCHTYIKVVFSINDNNNFPEYIAEILNEVTKYVEESEAPNCTSFVFEEVKVVPYGTTSVVEIYGRYSNEVDWV